MSEKWEDFVTVYQIEGDDAVHLPRKMIKIPAPGYGAQQGALEIHEPGSGEPAGAPNLCASCLHFRPLWGGHSGICFHHWRDLRWNDPVPLTCADSGCENHQPKEGHRDEAYRSAGRRIGSCR